mmetsp:Transcript_81523/g.209921  ORF Transcript_81523/g.209921 Transcript_81523/m.209921 type:complete len:218 (-) Transcript_81523:301-954(-)
MVSLPRPAVLTEAGKARLRCFVQQATSLQELLAIQSALDTGRLDAAMAARLQLTVADFTGVTAAPCMPGQQAELPALPRLSESGREKLRPRWTRAAWTARWRRGCGSPLPTSTVLVCCPWTPSFSAWTFAVLRWTACGMWPWLPQRGGRDALSCSAPSSKSSMPTPTRGLAWPSCAVSRLPLASMERRRSGPLSSAASAPSVAPTPCSGWRWRSSSP